MTCLKEKSSLQQLLSLAIAGAAFCLAIQAPAMPRLDRVDLESYFASLPPELEANEGDAVSQGERFFRIARGHIAEGTDEAMAVARRNFASASELGHEAAAVCFGIMAHDGLGGEHDPGAAEKAYLRAASSGSIEAMLNLGVLYTGEEFRDSTNKALHWFTVAAERGDLRAQNNAGVLLVHGFGGKGARAAEGLGWLLKAAGQDHSGAQTKAGILLCEGAPGVPVNYVEGIRWLRRADDAGNPAASYVLAVLCMEGRGVQQDDAGAARWFMRSAELGNPYAQTNLGAFYEEGRGVPRDPALASHFYMLAAEQGTPGAQYNLARLYMEGIGLDADAREAHKWCLRAAEAGIPDAINTLGEMTRNGVGCEPDPKEALRLFHDAAGRGSTAARINLALATVTDPSGTQPEAFDNAMSVLKEAAEAGNPRAANALGAFARDGRGGTPDHAEAVRLFRIGAESGFPPALCNLAYMLEYGLGTEVDDLRAMDLYRRAAEAGNAYAIAKLRHLQTTAER